MEAAFVMNGKWRGAHRASVSPSSTHQVGRDGSGDERVGPTDQGSAEQQHGCGRQRGREWKRVLQRALRAWEQPEVGSWGAQGGGAAETASSKLV